MKNRFIGRLAALALALCLVSGMLTGCAPVGEQDSQPVQPEVIEPQQPAAATLAEYPFTLPWYRGEGYNPYLTDNSLTVQVADLLFEKLVVIDPMSQLEYRVVSAVHTEGLVVTLQVASGYQYADGTPVTAQDVAASLNAARVSRLYKGRFAHVSRVAVQDDTTVVVTLSRPDALFVRLLDIPVMPDGQTDVQKPAASGRYTYAQDGDALVPNPASGETAPFDSITLWEMTGADALANSLNIGAISLYSTEAEGYANGINSSRQVGYYTNTMVFLGFNSIVWRNWKTLEADGTETWHSERTGVNALLETPAGRSAVNALLDRATLLERVYYNQGHVATGYMNTVGPVGGHGQLSALAEPESAAQTLQKLGYAQQLDGYYHLGDEAEPLTLRLVFYSGSSYKRYLAQLISDGLEAAGIKVQQQPCDTMDEYLQKIATLDFDMYIGEIKLYNNMDMSAFLSEGGAAAAGLTVSEELTAIWQAWQADTAQTAALEATLAAEMLFAPILWRSGTVYYAKALDGFTPSASSVFYGMEALSLS